MAINVPMPDLPGKSFLNGIDAGSTLFTRLMQPIIEREKQKQLDEHFKQELALKKAAAARAGANSDLNRSILEQQLLGLKHKNDPMYDFNQFQALQNMIMGGGQPGAQQTPEPQPTQEMGQGMGMFSPEGMQDAQSTAPAVAQAAPAVGGGNNQMLDALRQSPMLRGFFKHKFGYDPLGGESNILHGAARDASDLEKLRNQVGEDSPVYQNAKAQYDATLDAKKDLRDLRARTKQGLKPGEKEFFDENTGVPLGKEIPLTEKERDSEQGNILFNELYPYVYKGASPFSGEGSIGRLQQAAANYKTDPKARKLFDDFLLSEKMLAATTVNEASTLKAGRTNRTYNMLKESLEAQDIPRVIKKLVKEYGIPASAQLKAAMRYQELLSKARQKSKRETPATQKLFYNPEMQTQTEENKSGNSVNESKMINGKKYEKINGEWYESE